MTITRSNRLPLIILTVVTLLMIPFIAMQFSTEVNWSGFDFAVMGALLLGTGLTVEFFLRKVRTTKYRLVVCAAVVFAFLIVWAELAVGVFGTPFAGS